MADRDLRPSQVEILLGNPPQGQVTAEKGRQYGGGGNDYCDDGEMAVSMRVRAK